MKNKTRIISTLLLLAFAMAFLPLQTVHAKGILEEGKLILGSNFTLEAGEELDGDLVVLGGNVVIEKGASVNGAVVVFGGNIDSSGSISKELVSFGGNIDISASGSVGKDVVNFGGNINIDPKADVKGEIVQNTDGPVISLPDSEGFEINPPSVVDYQPNPLANALGSFLFALAMGALAMLLSVFLQPQIEKVGFSVSSQPVVAGGFGLLTVLLAPLAIVLLAITLILIPVAAIAVFVIIFAWLFGIIAMGQEVGNRFAKAINKEWAPVLSAGFGTFLLMLVVGFIDLIPCLGQITNSIVGLLAIGAALLTWFGSRNRALPAAPAVPASPADPAAGS